MTLAKCMTIRPGKDAEGAVEVLRRSITELCKADHGDDPEELDPWLANKTEETWKTWVRVPGATVLVAEVDGRIAGVAMMSARGVIQVNYVSPDARFTGVSSALIIALEEAARRRGFAVLALQSTLTTCRFYISRGYRPTGPDGKRMEKTL